MDSFLPILLICVSLILIFSATRRNAFSHLLLKRRRRNIDKREIENMSKMLQELVGKEVRIYDIILGASVPGTVIEVDDKWLKLEKTNKKGELVYTKIIAIDSIGNIEIK